MSATTIIQRVESNHAESTGQRYISCLNKWAEWCEGRGENPVAATAIDVEGYLSELHNKHDYSYKTVNVHLSAIRSFFEAADALGDAGKIDTHPADLWEGRGRWENPTENVALNNIVTDKAKRLNTKKERAMSGDERHALPESDVQELFESVPSPTVRNALMLRIAYQGMLRRTEVARLKISDINRQEGSITIRPEVSKNGEERTTYYMDSLSTLLSSWLDVDRGAYDTAADSEYVFVSNDRERIHEQWISQIFRNTVTEAGLDNVLYTNANGAEKQKVTFHSLRHSGAVRRWENGADLRTLQILLGHKDISTTQQYLDVDLDDVGAKARRYW